MADSTDDVGRAPRAGAVGSPDLTRRTLIRGGSVVLGAAVVWTAPNIRSTALAADTAGTPAPVKPASATPGGATDPTDPAAGSTVVRGGTLPLTGIDPKPLIVAGTATLAAGAAIVAVSQDAQPSRGEPH